MQDIKKEIHLRYEEKAGNSGPVKILKDQDGNVKFIKIGFGAWEKVSKEVNISTSPTITLLTSPTITLPIFDGQPNFNPVKDNDKC